MPDNIFPLDKSSGIAINSGVYVEYNQIVSIVNPAGITINGQPAQRVEVTDNYFLRIYNTASGSNNFARNTEYIIKIAAGAITGTRNNSSQEDLSFSFTTVGAPTFSVDPPVGSTVNLPIDSEAFTVNITFSEDVIVNASNTITDDDDSYYAYVQSGSVSNVVQVNILAVNVYSNAPMTSMTIPSAYITDVFENPITPAVTLFYNLNFNPVLLSITPDPSGNIITSSGNFETTLAFKFNQAITNVGTPVEVISSGNKIVLESWNIDDFENTLNVICKNLLLIQSNIFLNNDLHKPKKYSADF